MGPAYFFTFSMRKYFNFNISSHDYLNLGSFNIELSGNFLELISNISPFLLLFGLCATIPKVWTVWAELALLGSCLQQFQMHPIWCFCRNSALRNYILTSQIIIFYTHCQLFSTRNIPYNDVETQYVLIIHRGLLVDNI